MSITLQCALMLASPIPPCDQSALKLLTVKKVLPCGITNLNRRLSILDCDCFGIGKTLPKYDILGKSFDLDKIALLSS